MVIGARGKCDTLKNLVLEVSAIAIKPRLKDCSFTWYKQNKLKIRVAKDHTALKFIPSGASCS